MDVTGMKDILCRVRALVREWGACLSRSKMWQLAGSAVRRKSRRQW